MSEPTPFFAPFQMSDAVGQLKERLGAIDRRQLRALIRASLKSEWRILASRQARLKTRPSAWYIVWSLLTYVVLGAVSSLLILSAENANEAAVAMSVTASYLCLITVLNIFVSFGAGFLSSSEQKILSIFPITSETFFLSRILILLVYTSMIGMAMVLPAAVMLSIASRSVLLSVLSAVGMMFLAVTCSSLMIVVILSALLQSASGKKMARALAIGSLLGTFFSLASILLLPSILEKRPIDLLTAQVSGWIHYYPGYWLGSFARIPFGEFPLAYFVTLVLLIPMLALVAFKVAAKHFDASLAKLDPVSAEKPKRVITNSAASPRIRFRSFEGRVVWRLFSAQLRREPRFRMQMVAILPLTLLYFAVALFQYGAPVDPFVNPSAALHYNQLYLVALLSPLLLMEALSQSEWYKASWVFFSSPIDRSKLLLATRTIVLTVLFLPYLTFLAILFIANMPLSHALMHTAMIAIVALIIFEVYLMVSPKLPFSRQKQQSKNSFSKFLWVFLIMAIPLAGMAAIMHFAYSRLQLFAASFALLLTVLAITEFFVRRRLSRKLESAEFQ